jgi:hypothetical protein
MCAEQNGLLFRVLLLAQPGAIYPGVTLNELTNFGLSPQRFVDDEHYPGFGTLCQGASVVLGAQRVDRLQSLAEELTASGGEAIAVALSEGRRPPHLSPTGNRQRLFYPTKTAALLDANRLMARRNNFGVSLSDMTPAPNRGSWRGFQSS